jgi:glycosyltransferase involved in cell wall biosynthesis
MKIEKIVYARTQFWFNLKAGGSVSHTIGVLQGFKKNNCQILILSNEEFTGIGAYDRNVVKPRFFINHFNTLGELLYNFTARKRFEKAIIAFKPDIIYHRYSGKTFFIAGIAKKLKIPLILEFNAFHTWVLKHWNINKNLPVTFFNKYILSRIVKKIEDYNINNSAFISVVSEQLKRDLMQYGVAEDKIFFCPNGVDMEKFDPSLIQKDKTDKIRNLLNLKEKKKIVGFIGTFGPWHGIYQLVDAIKSISGLEQFKSIYFLLIGDGDLKKYAENELVKYGNVIFTGNIPYSEIQNYLSLCDVLVSPHCCQIDRREFFGSPTKLFEYMAMGKGIVASRIGQIGEILENKKTGILVEPENVSQLVGGIIKLLGDDRLRTEYGANARKEVMEKYTWKKNIEKLLLEFEMKKNKS